MEAPPSDSPAPQQRSGGKRPRKTKEELRISLQSAAKRVHGAGHGGLDAVALKQEAVMREVLDADSLAEVMHIANSLPPLWLMDVDELPGNVFRAWAFGILEFQKRGQYHGLRDLAVIFILLVQAIGPLLVVNNALAGWGQFDGSWYDWSSFVPSLDQWRLNWNTNIVRLFLLFAYWMNAFISMEDAWQDWLRVFKVHNFLAKRAGGFEFALYLGAFTKCWCVFWCCNATFLAMGTLDNPLDVMFDLVGLLFVIGLDGLGGDLSLVPAGSWPSLGLGWIEDHLDDIGTKIRPEYEAQRSRISPPPWVKPLFMFVKYYCFVGVFVAPIVHIMTPWHLMG
eukprot:TRINITY_DN28211_c0_g1_i1.p1 TRINITY_DN28211_c0_g1~~TRINITY_DN28211_c0_g1_i1.p1  ORF type:complete len:338 (-),score=59.20 TRINITY_DN28211_c0_g1_i1:1-1014(-)